MSEKPNIVENENDQNEFDEFSINVKLTKERDLIDTKWKIIINGKNWIEPEIIEGCFGEDSQTIITTPDFDHHKREMIYKIIAYALGD